MFRFLLVLCLLALASLQADAQTGQRPAQKAPPKPAPLSGFDLTEIDPYARCLERASRAPLAALAEAEAWRGRGGGDAARHCAALAILHGGDPRLAAEELESLARALRLRPASLRAQVLAQAAQAWSAAGDMPRAQAAISTAISLVPEDVELRIDRAQIRAETGALREAIEDLDQVLARAPRRADALAMRAAAHRRRGAVELAAADVAAALAVEPNLPDAWLERGILARLSGRADDARASWIRVLAADPDGPVGDAARLQIEALELGAPPPKRR
jgi:tetratricopeptide (TPR) repeat protein